MPMKTSNEEKNNTLYLAREKRFYDAIKLTLPDRVPITISFYFFASHYYGMTAKDVMYDGDKLFESQAKANIEFEPDVAQNPFFYFLTGSLYDILDSRLYAWPGRQLADDVPFQFVEGEYMKADEYDHLFSSPIDFIIRKYWPRTLKALNGFGSIPPLKNFADYMGPGIFGAFADPEVQKALDVLKDAGRENMRILSYAGKFDEEMIRSGFPIHASGTSQAPFDLLGDYLRGTKGLMLDMYRQPQNVLKACELLLPQTIDMGIQSAQRSNAKMVFIALHKGLDGFMSLDQFKKFYWPTLKELLLALINKDLIPYVFWEGDCTSRLDCIKNEIPAGKAMYRFEATDIFKAKDALRDKVCIRGNVPASLLATGTPDDVRSCCKKLIDYVGKGGGYIMDASANVSDAKPENLRAMFDFTREYGVY
jgi:hypothetical protein